MSMEKTTFIFNFVLKIVDGRLILKPQEKLTMI